MIAFLAATALAQPPRRPTFQVTRGKTSGSSLQLAAPGLVAKNLHLAGLLRMAYDVREVQVIGAPDWLSSDTWDITATGVQKPAHASPEQVYRTISTTLQALFTEKFQLKFHREQRELPVYLLTVAKGGARLARSQVANCAEFNWRRRNAPGTDRPTSCGAAESGPNMRLDHTLDAVGMSIVAPLGSLDGLVTFLSRQLDRIIIDKTGLKGRYDFHLEWDRKATAEALVNEHAVASDDTGPSLFRALLDQLGLSLDPGKAPVEVIVIDHVEKPAENTR